MARLESVSIYLRSEHDADQHYSVDIKYWDMLKKLIKQGPPEWIELNSVWGDGAVFIFTGDITNMFKCSQEYCIARDAFDKDEKDAERFSG